MIWDQTRAAAAGRRGYVHEDDDVLLATDFECAGGANLRREGEVLAVDLEPEPGDHVFGGVVYYFCVGIREMTAASDAAEEA